MRRDVTQSDVRDIALLRSHSECARAFERVLRVSEDGTYNVRDPWFGVGIDPQRELYCAGPSAELRAHDESHAGLVWPDPNSDSRIRSSKPFASLHDEDPHAHVFAFRIKLPPVRTPIVCDAARDLRR